MELVNSIEIDVSGGRLRVVRDAARDTVELHFPDGWVKVLTSLEWHALNTTHGHRIGAAIMAEWRNPYERMARVA